MIAAHEVPIDPTPEQVARIRDVLAAEPSPEAVSRRLHDAVHQVLTPDQRTAIAKHRLMRHVEAMYAPPLPAIPAISFAPAVHLPAAHLPSRRASDPAIEQLRPGIQSLRRGIDVLRKLIDRSSVDESKR